MLKIHDIIEREAYLEVLKGDREGVHSSAHWNHVSQLSVLIAEAEGVDPVVPYLFGFYHDCRRVNDGHDPAHGDRASDLVREHYEKGWLKISKAEMEILVYACEYHPCKKSTDNKIIGVCWDADRLTLPRVGIQTHLDYLHTDVAKKLAMMQYGIYSG